MNNRQRKKYGKQRIKPRDLWNLDYTIAKFIYPRLKAFKEIINTHPSDMSFEEWKNTLDKMILAFELLCLDKWCDDEEQNKINEGLKLFAEYYQHLWD